MVRQNLRRWSWFGASAALLALTGCSLSPESNVDLASGALLARAHNCDDLLGKIQADAVAKVDQQVTDAITAFDNAGGTSGSGGSSGTGGIGFADAGTSIGGNGGFGGAAGIGGFGGSGGAPSSAGSGGSGGSGGLGTDSGGGAGRGGVPADHSDTTTQVAGVDEADIVKSDGQHIFLLHGSALFIVDAWPASSLAVGAPIAIEGQPSEMFVHDGNALVYSTVYGYSESNGYDYPYYDGYGGYYGGSPFTKLTQIDLDASAPTVTRELYIEGSYISSRRHDNVVRSVIQGGFKAPTLYTPSIEYVDAWGRPYDREAIKDQLVAWRDRTVAGIQNTELSDWLPIEQQRIGGVLSDAPRRCDQFYAPAPGATSYGLTNIVAIDLDRPDGALSGALVLGQAGTVYANADTLVLGQAQQWYDHTDGSNNDRTRLHRFDLDGANTTYTASGFVNGQLLNQFALDESEGVIRAASTTQNWNSGAITNRITTFSTRGQDLAQLGQSDNLGHEGEQIYAVRYVGDIGYVVTFRQTDPLIAVDLSDASKPTVLGEALIPGFSTFMQPFADGTHLLTIGELNNGVQLQVFDVSDPTHPSQTHVFPYMQSGWSEANSNQKAFTFWESRGLLAFPYTNYGDYYYNPASTLEVFSVDTQDGFAKLGSINHTDLLLANQCVQRYDDGIGGFYYDYYGYCPSVDVRRGLFMGDGDQGNFVYAVSYGGITVHNISDINTTVASVPLPYPTYDDGMGPFIGGTGGIGAIGGFGGDTAGFGGIGGFGGVGGSSGTGASGAGGVGGSADGGMDMPIDVDAGL